MAATDCIYCLGLRNDPIQTSEHIWPASLGGRAAPALFRTDRVCGKCNSLAGLFVDGPFRKSWFVQNEGVWAHEFLDPNRPSALPLIYMGFEHAFPTEASEVCERWTGPTGEHVYHIHQKDDPRWDTVAGGDFIKRRKSDGGRAYIVLTSDVGYWVETALLSFAEWFPHATRRCVTLVDGDISSFKILNLEQPPISPREHVEIEHIRLRRGNQQFHVQFPIQVDFADRFMSKVALGLSSTILGERSVRSPYADNLRTSLWGRSRKDRQGLSLRGTSYLSEQDERFTKFAGCAGAWTILLYAMSDGFSYTAIAPSGRRMAMLISDDPTRWPDHIGPLYGHGVVFIVIPERQRWIGPVPLFNYVVHNLGLQVEPVLNEIDKMRKEAFLVPAKR